MSDPERTGPPAVAIVGLVGRFPGASDVEQFWRNLRAGRESIHRLADEEIELSGADPEALDDPNYVKAAPLLDGIELFDPEFFGFTQREAEITDPQHRIFLECAWEALESAGCDPARFDGTVGIYAGSGTNGYLGMNLLAHRALVRSVGAFQLGLGNDKDYLTSRVSYKLDLKGPSVNVQTACSTSLVAVHLASQGLTGYECDLALAGGVSIGVPQKVGYHHTPDGITSPDGHCRTFDARAAGTIFGSGVGLVVLKRLEDALADGDTIWAVLRGSAINNDGAVRAGFTAPGVDGQVGVISEALAAAEVDPTTVGLVEAHGTATPLGDPIEIAALTEVFRAAGAENGSCAVGSVKSNVGHLDTAAGVTGLIKAVLALHHREILPSLHFEEPNPRIDFAASPFRVATELRPWTSNGAPRRAGVSSFGIGGSNAHVVLEEAPPAVTLGPSRPAQLLLLSARGAAALAAAASNLGRHLEAHPEQELADVAHTLQVGRRAFEHRGVVVCRERGAAVDALTAGRFPTHRAADKRPVVFLFPGQGAQYPNMGRELWEHEAVFRDEVDACAETLRPHLGLDLRRLLYPDDGDLDETGRRLGQTAVTQPALFTVELALARLWMSWGVEPRAMLGHSVGELVAACVAGVVGRDDALALVAERGRRMQELPGGAMLSVPLGEDELELAGGELSLAALNGPRMSVVSGPVEAIDALARELAGRGLDTRRLHTSHAFHSAAMEPILEPLERAFARCELRSPRIPFVSNLTGARIRDGEATDPAYWARQARRPVRFAQGLEELLADPETAFLEVGPGQTLATLARRHPSWGPERVAVTSLRRPSEQESPTCPPPGEPDLDVLLGGLGRLWMAGAEIDWTAFSGGERRRRLPLPTYPFERRRCWIDPRDTGPREAAASVPEETPAGAARPLLSVAWAAPRDELEGTVVRLWQELLGIEPVGVDDDFFELGGHSLLATQLVTLVRRETGVDLPMRQLFDAPTPARLAGLIRERRASPAAEDGEPEVPTIVPDLEHRFEPFPLTDVQQAYWLGRGDQYELGNVATHMYLETENADLDLERFTGAWRRLIDRHATLRTVIEPDGRQRVLEEVPPFTIPTLDLRHRGPDDAQRELAAVRERMSHQVLPADRWPLFEVRASRLADGRVRTHLSFDFLLGDAWSWRILFDDLRRFYRDPELELPELDLGFRDCVLAEIALRESPTFRRSLDYWRGRLADLAPAPELPLAKQPAEIERPRFVRSTASLSAAAWTKLKARASAAGLTPSGVLLAAFAEALAAWSAAPRFSLTLTLFHRPPFHPRIDEILGDFTSLVLLEADTTSGDTFEARARRLQQRLWEDLDHRWVSGVRVLRELAQIQGHTRAVAMPVVFTSTLHIGDDPHPQPLSQGERGAGNVGDEMVYSISQTPQVWIDHQVGEEVGALVFNWDVVEELFPPGLVEAMFGAYCGLLERLAEDETSWREGRSASARALVGDVELTARDEPAPVPGGLLHEPFFARAAEHPERPAVIAPRRTLSYGELAHRSRRLARRLHALGARPNQLVAVVMDKGWEQVVAVLAVLRAGGAYLPVEASLPERRVRWLLDNGEVDVVLTQPRLEASLAWPEGITRVVVDDTPGEIEGELPPSAAGPEDLAYVIYTSGSTGEPKGVMIDHRGALNTCLDVNRRFRVGPEDRVLALSSLAFDLSVWDVFGLLAAGGALVLPEPGARRDPERWAALMTEHRVSLWNSVPALVEMLVESLEARQTKLDGALRRVLLSGDWIPVTLPGRLRALAPGDVGVTSLGGATEASIWSILYEIGEVPPGWTRVPYGRAMDHQDVRVLDHALEPRPVWVPGDLCIGGVGLARGYWRDEARTAAAFVRHPETGERLYRTGDTGRLLPDGDIDFLGRRDLQVKLRGYRIELGEIEAALEQHPAVGTAVVLVRDGDDVARHLAGFIVPEPERDTPSSETFQAFLAERLPEYMVPSIFQALDRLPLTANGKVDRDALERTAPAPEAPDVGPDAGPRTELEARLVDILGEVLGVDGLGVGDNFFEHGGDSLLATRATYRIRKAFGVELPVARFFEAATVAELAVEIAEQVGDGGAAPVSRDAGPAAAPARSDEPAAAPAASRAEAPAVLADPGFWRTLEARGRRRAAELQADPEIVAEADDEPRVERIAAALVSAALARLGLFTEAGERRSFAELAERVAERHRKALRRWLEMLAEDDLLEYRDEMWISRRPLTVGTARDLATGKEAHLSPETLVELITGERHALELLIPDDSSQELEASYREAPMFRYCNAVCETVIDQVVAVLPADAAFDVLEVGAGTGGTTASLLPRLPAERTRYVYTDVSKFFTDLGRRKFVGFTRRGTSEGHPFLNYAELDIERDPFEQGFEPGSFDLVVAAHVLHATRRVDETLAHVRSLLRPNGLLLLLEEIRFRRPFNFSMGFVPGFDRFEDTELRRLHPLLSTDAWRAALVRHGFAEAVSFTEPGSRAEVLGVDVLVARALAPRRSAPLSFAQERLWRFETEHPGTACYNVSNPIRLDGPLDPARLERSLARLARRQGTLRTAFEVDGGRPRQVVVPDAGLTLPTIDLSGLPAGEAAARAEAVMEAAARRPFDLAGGPPARALLVRLGERRHVLHLTLHHLVTDGLSLGVLARDLGACSPGGGQARNYRERPNVPVPQYADLAVEQQARLERGELEDVLAFWRRQLRGLPDLELPGRRSGGPEGFARSGVPVEVDARLAASLRELASSARATLFITLLAALGAWLHRATGQRRIAIATPFAQRDREELSGLAGLLIHMLPLCLDLGGEPTFRELIARARETAAAAFGHPEIPFERLASELDLPGSALGCRVMFNMPGMEDGGEAPASPSSDELTFEPLASVEMGIEFDLSVYGVDGPEGLDLHIVYRRGRFERGAIEKLARDLAALLEAIVADPGSCGVAQ